LRRQIKTHPKRKKPLPSDTPLPGSKLLANPGALCNIVKRIAVDAGAITLRYFDGIEDMGVTQKGDGSPVTLADQEAEAFIEKALKDIIPHIPMIGEESVSRGDAPAIPATQEYFWLVDALDGTREFIGGGQDYTVNIALIQNGEPVLGVVYAPARGELYAGHGEGTATRYFEDSDNEKSASVRAYPKEGLTVMASKHHGDTTRLDAFLESFKVKKFVRHSSSLKMCLIAIGKGDIYPRFGPTCEWDTAAAHAVMNAAGGVITDMDGKPLRYGGPAVKDNDKWLNAEFVACAFEWADSGE
jgi:3'(2'), 5'-bisphosphate nucleotidase